MAKFRRVSASNASEAVEVNVAGAIESGSRYIITTGSLTTWPDEVDFITYSRDENGDVDEATRVEWTAEKVDDNNLLATRVNDGSYVPGPTDFAAVVPMHNMINDLVDGVSASLDGSGGFLTTSGSPFLVSIGGSAPGGVPGKTTIWFKRIS